MIWKVVKERLKLIKYEVIYIFCNYIVCNIPIWFIRKSLYQLLGMKIGSKSRILLKTKVIDPWKVVIGNRTTINEGCFLDGRGGLAIGDDTSISFGTKILTADHDIKSSDFSYQICPVEIGDRVFIGIHAIVLKGCTIEDNVVIAAGSVTKTGKYSKNKIYSGIPAVYVKERELEGDYKLGTWLPWFI